MGLFGLRKKNENKSDKAVSKKPDWAETLAEETGISAEEARKRLDRAYREYGIPAEYYCKNKYYELSEAGMATQYIRDSRVDEKREARYELIQKYSGKNRKQAQAELRQIRKNHPGLTLSRRWYFDNGVYQYDPEKDKQTIEDIISMYLRKNELQEELNRDFDAVDRGEITYSDTEEKLTEYRKLVKNTLSEGRKHQLAELISGTVTDKSEDELDEILIDMELTDRVLGFFGTEYLAFHFWDKTIPERREYVSAKFREKVIRELNTEEGKELLDSKFDAYQRLKPYYKREAVLLDADNGFEEFKDFAGRHPVFVKKNNFASLGVGVRKVDIKAGDSLKEIYNEITKDPGRAELEELIVPSEKLKSLNPDSVNTVRIIVLCDENGAVVQDTFMKVGRQGSFVDNGGAGGILVHVDPTTGIFDSQGIDEKCIQYIEHPDHAYRFEGFALPDWEVALETAKAASRDVPEAKYIGWDLTHTENNEWVIVEGNSKTQFFAQQMTRGRGVKKEFMEAVNYDMLINNSNDGTEEDA